MTDNFDSKLVDDVNQVLFETFPSIKEKISNDLTADDVEEWDSMNHLNLVMRLNTKFDVSLDFEEVFMMETVGNIYSVMAKKVANK